MTAYDVIIRNGLIVDGTGDTPFEADVGVRNGLIADIKPGLEGSANQEFDASGKLVTPGFVDVHTHYDGQATWDTYLQPSSNLGATTVVMGNCGVGFAPCRPADRDCLVELMEGVEEIPGSALAEGLAWNWESFPEYLDALEARSRDIDIAVLLPHGPLRVFVMGQRGVERQAATADDIAAMRKLLKQGLDAGAVGFSTSRTLVHLSSSGEHVPTYQAATSELKQLGEELSGDAGHVMQMIADWEDPDAEFDILRHISRETGATSTFTLLPIDTTLFGMDDNPNFWREQLARVDESQQAGLNIRAQVISRPVGILMGHPASMSPFYQRPSFVELADLPWDERIKKLADPMVRAKILSESNVDAHIFVQLLDDRYQVMYPLEDPIEYLPDPENSVARRAEREGVEPQAWLYDFLLGNNGSNLIYIPAANSEGAIIPDLLGHPYTVAALGDGGAHVGSICDTSSNVFLLTKWVRQQAAFDIARGIRMLTREPAELYALNDRGLLAVGKKADINIIDWPALQLRTPHIVHDLPAGGKRFMQHADGIEATFVSGELICAQGQPTGALPGRLIRGTPR